QVFGHQAAELEVVVDDKNAIHSIFCCTTGPVENRVKNCQRLGARKLGVAEGMDPRTMAAMSATEILDTQWVVPEPPRIERSSSAIDGCLRLGHPSKPKQSCGYSPCYSSGGSGSA